MSDLFDLYSFSRDNPFFSGIDAMPDIRPRKKSIPLVSELVGISTQLSLLLIGYFFPKFSIKRS